MPDTLASQRRDRGAAFGRLIATARERANISQRALADQTGVGRAAIGRWESGTALTPHPDHVRAVCAALDIDPVAAAVALGYLAADDLAAVA